jgi:hypothetical protein
MPPFVVFALPRSRSAWLSRLLTYGEWRCGHDTLLDHSSLEGVRAALAQPCTGCVETAAAPFWRLLRAWQPGARVVTLRRPVPQVAASLQAFLQPTGVRLDPVLLRRVLEHAERKLDQIEARLPGVLPVRFADLHDEDVCAEVFEHCLPYRHDPAWWREIAARNVQMSAQWFVNTLLQRRQQYTDLAEAALRAHRRDRAEEMV